MKHLVVLALGALAAIAQARELTLRDAMGLAGDSDPQIASARRRESAAEAAVSGAKAGYLPSIALEAADSPGYPGSSADLGVTGLMGSPFHAGAAGGVVAKIPIWDFGRTSWKVEEKRYLAQEKKEETRLTKFRVYERALYAFIECTKLRSEEEAWESLSREAELVGREVRSYVKTGQRQIVESYFADGQTEEARSALEGAKERYAAARRDLALLTGLSEEVECPSVPSEDDVVVAFEPEADGSPLVAKEEASHAALRASVEKAQADYLPKVSAVFSAGAMQSSHAVPEKSYAAGVGIIFPLFDGFRTRAELSEATALADSKESDIESRRLEIKRMNATLDGIIASSRARLRHIEQEISFSKKAFELAKRRYLALEGSVADMREAFRTLSRPTSERLEARATLLRALGAKALWNGARLRVKP